MNDLSTQSLGAPYKRVVFAVLISIAFASIALVPLMHVRAASETIHPSGISSNAVLGDLDGSISFDGAGGFELANATSIQSDTYTDTSRSLALASKVPVKQLTAGRPLPEMSWSLWTMSLVMSGTFVAGLYWLLYRDSSLAL